MATKTESFVNQRHAMLAGFNKAGKAGYTDEEAARAAQNERRGFWVRASELRKQGLIEAVEVKGMPEFRLSSEGGFQGVWRITQEGRQRLRDWNKMASA